MKPFAWSAAAALTLVVTAPGAHAGDPRFGPADPVVKDASRLDSKRPIERELQASVPDGFAAAVVGDLIISRPLSQYAGSMPRFSAVLDILRGSDVTFGNLETTIFDPRTFEGAPYSWDGDWTNASVPAVARDLKTMGFSIVGRANNHSQDWGLDGMRETAKWLDDAGIAYAGAGDTHRMARARPISKARRAASPWCRSRRPSGRPASRCRPGRPRQAVRD